MGYLRRIKIILVCCVAFFALLVSFNNLADYGSNYDFFKHVLSMDTTFPNNSLMYRSIENSLYYHGFYWLIILTEGLVGMFCCIGAWRMWRSRNQDKASFNAAKKMASAGLALGIVLWFTGFMTIGAEWFLMWQSTVWNGQASAFRFVVVLFLVLVFLHQVEE